MMEISSTLVLIKLTVLTDHWLSLWLNIDSVPFSLRVACEQAPGGASAEETFGVKRRVRGLLLPGLRRMFRQRLLLQEPVHRLVCVSMMHLVLYNLILLIITNQIILTSIILPHDVMEDRWIAVSCHKCLSFVMLLYKFDKKIPPCSVSVQ